MMFDLWPVYSGERFRASWPSCFSLLSGLCLLFYLFIFFVLIKLLNYVSVAFPLWQLADTLHHLDFFLFHFVKISAKCVILC